VVTPTARREVVGFLRESFGMSERRACRAIGMNRSTIRYETRRAEPADLRARLRELAQARPRFGYRRLHVLLRREGRTVNHKRIYRLYRQEGLTVRRRARKRVARGRGPIRLSPTRTNQRWAVCHRPVIPGERAAVQPTISLPASARTGTRGPSS
jgi:putative transposase